MRSRLPGTDNRITQRPLGARVTYHRYSPNCSLCNKKTFKGHPKALCLSLFFLESLIFSWTNACSGTPWMRALVPLVTDVTILANVTCMAGHVPTARPCYCAKRFVVVVVVAVDTNDGRSQHLAVCVSCKRHSLVDNSAFKLVQHHCCLQQLPSKRCFLWSTILDALIYTMADIYLCANGYLAPTCHTVAR